jgi:predicted nucleic acid-binding protein
MLYLDSSAIVKLVVTETESDALRSSLRFRTGRASSALAHVEVRRAVAARQPSLLDESDAILHGMTFVGIDDDLLRRAAGLPPRILRTLDAIHIASALLLGDELEALITYDRRMAEAAESMGITVVSPR